MPTQPIELDGLTISALESKAQEIAGLTDFGDLFYREALSHLIEAYRTEANLDAPRAAMIENLLTDLLVRRLQTEERLKHFDGGKPVVTPWVILGMPRCGTTALHRLLCADPAAQGLEHWLALYPQPRPPRDQWATNPDYVATVERLERSHAAAPRVSAQHGMHADEADECYLLRMQDFVGPAFATLASVPSYEKWLLGRDMTPAYHRHRALLSLIDGGQGRRWILKDPSHLRSLDAMLQTYPDMRVLFPRRPATEFLPSVSSLIFEARRAADPSADREAIGRRSLQMWSRTAHELQAWRKTHGDVPWFEFDHREFRADPIGICQAVYASAGETLSAEAETAMRDVLKTGLNAGATIDKPTLKMFGLSRAAVVEAFPAEFV